MHNKSNVQYNDHDYTLSPKYNNHNYTLSPKNYHHSWGKKERQQDIAIEMALPLTIANEIRCISHILSHTSPFADTMWLPRLRRKTSVDSLITPDVSTAIGWTSSLAYKGYELHLPGFGIRVVIFLCHGSLWYLTLHYLVLPPKGWLSLSSHELNLPLCRIAPCGA